MELTVGPHPLHSGTRDWTEINCYVDLWVELLNGLGLEPRAACACALSADFHGDQWEMLKFPAHDLWQLWGITVDELNVWRPVLDHTEEHLELSHLLTVEVDAWWLPDTAGTSYHARHTKTTIVPVAVSRATRELRYLHGTGAHILRDSDFDGLFGPPALPPYVEVVQLDRLHPLDPDAVVELARQHLEARPADNPVARLAVRLQADLPWLAGQDLETFHDWAFGVVRQCGATAELAADFLAWLPETGYPAAALLPAVASLREVSQEAKALQFTLARIARGRDVDPSGPLDRMAAAWAAGIAHATTALGTV